ncbi:MAG: trypsin-like peptidase domain-containing protein [Planctomycetes bacterium]|nr:trypsin-like peptidase domain-containing protein [Planctomycetota bacterium]
MRTMLLALLAAAPAVAAAPPDLYERARLASLEILVDDHLAGSGWFADPKGLAMTAAHVIWSGRRIEVLSPGAGRIAARIVAADRGRDIALLSVDPRPEGYPALPLATAMPAAGSTIYQIGAPIFRHAVLTRGAVAREGTTFEYLADQKIYAEIFHVSAMTPRGTSGGPWFTPRGEVVGIQSGMMRDGDAAVGIAFVAPLEAVRALLATGRSAATPTFEAAIEEFWEQNRSYTRRFPPRTEGIVVRNPAAGGAAARAGLAEWDLIAAIDGTPVRYRDDLLRAVRAKAPGDEVTFTVRRGGDADPRSVTVRLERLERGIEAKTERER